MILVFLAARRSDLLFSMFSFSEISQCFSIMLNNGSMFSFPIVCTFSDDDNSNGISCCNGLFNTNIFADFPNFVQAGVPLTFLFLPIITFSITPFFKLNRGVELFSFISTVFASFK